MGDIWERRLFIYRGHWVIEHMAARSYGIEGSCLYLISPDVAKRIIDTYIERTSADENKLLKIK